MRAGDDASDAWRHRAVALALFLATAAPATAQDAPADVRTACTASSNLSDTICACVAQRSADRLSADQRAFYVAALDSSPSRRVEPVVRP
jgi:hypothetical protein